MLCLLMGKHNLWKWMLYFFFQAEDGIRDGHVTGVQTCALPISPGSSRSGWRARTAPRRSSISASGRSEERRVGKECRGRGAREDCRKKDGQGAAGQGKGKETIRDASTGRGHEPAKVRRHERRVG